MSQRHSRGEPGDELLIMSGTGPVGLNTIVDMLYVCDLLHLLHNTWSVD